MSEGRVLIVDDSESGRYIKAHILERAGFDVHEGGTLREAWTVIESWKPQLVLLDVKLPDGSGLDFCRRIKSFHPGILVIQTSAAFVTPEDRAAGLEGGADSYLVEPIDAEELAASVRALMRQTIAERDLREQKKDLDQRLEEEIRSRTVAEDTLRHALKLDALGQLTGGIAHDFNNLLTVVLGSFTLIERTVKRANGNGISPEQLLRYIDSGRKAASDCEYLTRRLLAFARRGPLSAEIVDVQSTIQEFGDLLRRAAGERIEISYDLEPQAWRVRMDPNQFEAALLNLVVNARDAMPVGGALIVATRNVTVGADPLPCPTPEPLTPGDYVTISITDTGTGMAEDVIAHAFEPFFTTKDIGRGTGLGLSQVYGFAKQSNGGVGISSRVNRGTTICLYLPRSTEHATPDLAPEKPDGVPQGRETVLVVEDNEQVLDFTVETLQDLGYRVLQAMDGASALEVLDREKVIDLLFTDVVMPNNMTGIDLAARARSMNPRLKVLLTSGHMPEAMRETARRSDFEYIPKPYNPDELARRLRSVLAS